MTFYELILQLSRDRVSDNSEKEVGLFIKVQLIIMHFENSQMGRTFLGEMSLKVLKKENWSVNHCGCFAFFRFVQSPCTQGLLGIAFSSLEIKKMQSHKMNESLW